LRFGTDFILYFILSCFLSFFYYAVVRDEKIQYVNLKAKLKAEVWTSIGPSVLVACVYANFCHRLCKQIGLRNWLNADE